MNENAHSSCSESEPFALQVLGHDMEPEFPKGCIIVAEPNAVLIDGCYVIAQHEDEYLFRQLRINAQNDSWTLHSLQAPQQALLIAGKNAIRARVVQSTQGRRNTRKSYI